MDAKQPETPNELVARFGTPVDSGARAPGDGRAALPAAAAEAGEPHPKPRPCAAPDPGPAPAPPRSRARPARPTPKEHKSKRLRVWSFQRPHHFAFQASWLAFFAAFTSTFAPAALLPVIRDNLDLASAPAPAAGPQPWRPGPRPRPPLAGDRLRSGGRPTVGGPPAVPKSQRRPQTPTQTPKPPAQTKTPERKPQTKTDLGNAGIAAVVGAIAARVAMGNFVDVWGPRQGGFGPRMSMGSWLQMNGLGCGSGARAWRPGVIPSAPAPSAEKRFITLPPRHQREPSQIAPPLRRNPSNPSIPPPLSSPSPTPSHRPQRGRAPDSSPHAPQPARALPGLG